MAVIRREGPGASMEALAREAGVTKPILYRVFGHREGLLRALGERFVVELEAAIEAPIRAGDLDADPRAVVSATIDAFIGLVERDPNLYRFLTERLAGSPDRPLAGVVDDVARTIAVVLGERLRVLGADSGAAEPWAYGIVGMVHQATDWWLDRRTMPRERLVEYLTALVWEGMASLTPDPASQPAGSP